MQANMQLNQTYTISYSQPEAYRFSLDSVFLAQRINEWLLEHQYHPVNVADVCAGCGVVGLELLFHIYQRSTQKISLIDFIEVQFDYETHFEKNKRAMQALLQSTVNLKLTLMNYESLIGQTGKNNFYDLIICNPPYFHLGQGKLSPSNFKNRCRHFMDSDFSHLLKWIQFALSKFGSAFILVRDLNPKEFAETDLNYEFVSDVRGTQLFRLFH